jgi:APA family basic amino acid/polyamine antiporter
MATAAPEHGRAPASGAARQRGPFARKSPETLVAETSGGEGLRRSVGVLDLTALGLGAVIGTGIFVIIGEAIGKSGPAIVLSFVLAGITCVFSALSYSELASTIPVSGSAYTYGYATLGELLAWIIGWDLIIEYGFSIAVVAVGWGGYLQDLLSSLFGVHLPDAIANPPGEGGTINLPAVVLVLGVTGVLLAGVRESARTNTVMVLTKLLILVMFIGLAIAHFKGGNFKPFAPQGTGGVVDAAALIFFAYIGFDAISTSGEEAERPDRDLPRAIVGSLLIATVLYILVAVAAIGLVEPKALAGSDSPLTDALRQGGDYGAWAGDILSFGALVAITSVVLTVL